MKYKIEIKWAIIFTAVALLWVVFEKNMGWYAENIANHEANSYWFAIIAIAIYVFALLDKKKHLEEGAMTWKQGFMSGLVISIIVALLTPLSQFITHQLIAPEYFPNIIKYAVESEKSTQAEAESYFSLGNYILQSSVFALVIGIVTSAVVALFVKSKTKL